jgi:hypothetical protein
MAGAGDSSRELQRLDRLPASSLVPCRLASGPRRSHSLLKGPWGAIMQEPGSAGESRDCPICCLHAWRAKGARDASGAGLSSWVARAARERRMAMALGRRGPSRSSAAVCAQRASKQDKQCMRTRKRSHGGQTLSETTAGAGGFHAAPWARLDQPVVEERG